MDLELSGKRALITGSYRGSGDNTAHSQPIGSRIAFPARESQSVDDSRFAAASRPIGGLGLRASKTTSPSQTSNPSRLIQFENLRMGGSSKLIHARPIGRRRGKELASSTDVIRVRTHSGAGGFGG